MPRDLTGSGAPLSPANSSSDNNKISNSALTNAISLLNHPMTASNNSDDDDDDDEDMDQDSAIDNSRLDTESPTSKNQRLHTYCAVLTPSSLEACVALEEAVFPPAERASREKLFYRLKACNELCLGLFTIISDPPPTDQAIPTYAHARPIDAENWPGQKQVLIGMIVATKTAVPVVTDESMEIPDSVTEAQAKEGGSGQASGLAGSQAVKGHDSRGSTIAVHTMGILPSYQRQGLGRMMMRGYLQRMEQQEVGRRVSLIAHGPLVDMYKGMGFVGMGDSEVKFGGGGWENLVNEFKKPVKPSYGRAGGF